jgi:arylsulfatase A-like enzyme
LFRLESSSMTSIVLPTDRFPPEKFIAPPRATAGPGIPEGQSCDALAYLLDIFPTLCNLSEVETPASDEGRSLLACLKDQDSKLRPSLYLAYGKSIRGVTNGRHKLIEYATSDTQLFGLSHDPLEMQSIARQDSLSKMLTQLRNELRDLAQEWDDENHPKGKDFWAR